MQMLRRIWEDVRRGENIDLYLTVGVAIVLALLNVLGFAPQSLIAPVTLAVLGLLAINSLVNRRKIEVTLQFRTRCWHRKSGSLRTSQPIGQND